MFEWEDFINLCHFLINLNNIQYQEALNRTIISRAYYGVFKQVEDILEGFERQGYIQLPKEDAEGIILSSHGRIIYYLNNHQDEKVRRFGASLEKLKGLRNKADYKAQVSINKKMSENALKTASKLNLQLHNIKFLNF